MRGGVSVVKICGAATGAENFIVISTLPPGMAVYAMSWSTFSACAVPAIRMASSASSLKMPGRTVGWANPRSEHLADVVIM